MNAAAILQKLPQLSALVIGDICLDRWCTYDAEAAEPSRETGIPRIGVVSTRVTAGAGGTVANNLAALGIGRIEVLGCVGADGHGFELRQALSARGIGHSLLVETPGAQTFTYTKLIRKDTGVEDLPRVDFLAPLEMTGEAEQAILDRLGDAVAHAAMILVSDQAERGGGGVVTPRVRQRLAELAARHPEKIFLVDSRAHIGEFRRMILKPNEQEASGALTRLGDGATYEALRKVCQTELLLVTQGPAGVLLVRAGGESLVPTVAVDQPVDICGAGDSFSAGMASALAAGAPPEAAARFANLVTSITIMKPGTGDASPSEILEAERRRPDA